LTGSARLLQDIYRLDQYAFETNKRKLELLQTFALAQSFPFEFERARETGVLNFATPMDFFDRGFPGHYLRLIKRVSVSLIALIPPVQGVRATLMVSGVSRVVTGKDVFHTTILRREPELIAFTSSINASGVLNLEPEGGLLLPFEGRGVDTEWSLEIPKAANAFDYRTLTDVLFSIEYTALSSFEYRRQVIQRLNRRMSGERSYSIRQHFVDQWYQLHNPGSGGEIKITFPVRRADFAPNVENLRLEHLLLYFGRVAGATFEMPQVQLSFTDRHGNVFQDDVTAFETEGQGTGLDGIGSLDGVISTRRANGVSWLPLVEAGSPPFGDWQLTLPNTEEVRRRLESEQIEDILLVMSYAGETPPWTS
jgi:hypothetical protein